MMFTRLLSAAALFCAVTRLCHAEQIVFTEVMYNPAGTAPEFVEVVNLTSNRCDMAQWKLSGGVDYTFPAFDPGNASAHFLLEYERILLSAATPAATRAAYPSIPANVRIFGPWTGALNNAGETITLTDAAGTRVCRLTYGDSGKWPVAADGAGHSLVVRNKDRDIDDWRNWRASDARGGTPGSADAAATETSTASPELPIGNTVIVTQFNQNTGAANPGDTRWRYYNGTSAPQADWATVADAALPALVVPDNAANPGWGPATLATQGFAPLGTENAGAPFPGIRTAVAQRTGLVTYYYRTSFNWTGATTGCSFTIDHYLDDGGIYLLNGQEIGRHRMTNSSGHTNVTGLPSAPDATYEADSVAGGPGALDGKLVAGTNVFALELHQNDAASSDHVAAPRLKITVPATSSVVINEVKPSATAGQGFVEFYNTTGAPIDLNTWYLSDTLANLTKFRITTPLVVPAGGLATIGFAEANLSAAAPTVVHLTRPDGTTRVNSISATIPGDGRSLGRKPAGGGSWFLFSVPTPGLPNGSGGGLRLNEAHFGAGGQVDWVEIHNTSTAAIPGSALFVSSRSDFTDRVALPASVPGGGYASVPVNFLPDGTGDVTLFLTDAADNVLATAELTRRAGFPSAQYADGEWYNSPAATQDAVNAPPVSTAIVISEIMAGLPSSHRNGQFIELHNRSGASVSLAGWSFVDGLNFTFPAGSTLGAGQRAVVAVDPAYMTANYPGITNLFGPAAGRMKKNGELIRLEDANGNLADTVDFKAGGQWPSGTSGEGSSLELLHSDMDNSQPSAWRASDESAKAAFAPYTLTGVYRHQRGDGEGVTSSKELLMNLVSDGHVVLRNVSLTRAAAPGTNQITTGMVTSHTGSSAAGFHATGTHCQSDTLPDGFHLISTGSGDTKANKVEVDVTGIAANDTLTLSFEARWVTGIPLLVMQTWDRSFGKVFRLPVPGNLGTPGAVNSRAIAAGAPVVDQLRHNPPVPTSSQSVIVTARVASASPLTSVTLRERTDNAAANGTWNSIAMNDSGTGADTAAGDGIWSATVGAKADGAITEFYVTATAANGQTNECPRGALAVPAVNGTTLAQQGRPALWIVDNSPPTAAPGTRSQRFVLSQYARNAMAAGSGFSATYDWDHPRMSNFGWNATVIINESDVMYNGEIRRGGSPWTRTGGNELDRNRWKSPGDDLFRNRGKSGTDNDAAGGNRFHNRMVRYMLFLLGYPVPDSEFVQTIINQDSPRLGDDQEQTDSDFFNRAYENGTDGELFEIDDAWFMYDSGNMDNRIDAGSVTARWVPLDWSGAAPSPSAESPIFLHGNWPVRFPEDRYDYGALSGFIATAYNSGSGPSDADASWRERMERQIDVDRAAKYAAVRGYIGDWDNFTMNRGKNGYFYRRPTDGKFEFHHWDSDLGFDGGQAIIGGVGGTGWTNLVDRSWFRRPFNHHFTRLMQEFTAGSARMNAFLAAMNYQSANGDGLAPFKTGGFDYAGWFTNRNAHGNVTSQMNAVQAQTFSLTTAGGQTTAAATWSLSGLANSATALVDVQDHPEAVLSWTSSTSWTLSGIVLRSGLNALTVRAIGATGQILASLPHNVTLSAANAAPVPRLVTDPGSLNIALGEQALFDAGTSSDPEGAALSYTFTFAPGTGISQTSPLPSQRLVRFTIPGIYTVTLQVSDGTTTSTLIRQVSVFSTSDFISFGTGIALDPTLTAENVELRDNFSPSSWYSVEDVSGRLHIQMQDDVARPLTLPAAHPLITRDLPDAADFALQTDLEMDTRETGSFSAGLYAEFMESGQLIRYSFANEGGTTLAVRRSVAGTAYTSAGSLSYGAERWLLRIRRAGNQLVFERGIAGVWTSVHTRTLPAGSTAGRGGVFVSTSAATTVRAAFDYLLLADPSNSSSVLANLRITEIMYNPAGAGGVEYIEFTNTGSLPLNLNGVSFASGSPVDGLALGNVTLDPGRFAVVTNDLPAFRAQYGNIPNVLAQWPAGSLSNGGENITLLDADLNEVHNFSYDDDPLLNWPTAADGGGAALEIISTATDPFSGYALGASWRATAPGGTPGYLGNGGADTDGDGVSDAQEILAGTDPGNAGSTFRPAITQTAGGQQQLSWPGLPGRTYVIEWSPDLTRPSWSIAATIAGAAGTLTWTDPASATELRRFYRMQVLSP